ncbi:hypothetical protein [Nocardioides bizhenqiangii]|uniref:DUF4198 domain-containing protein n=1 Tax=Nocardioides bizhenqiangii TaxID=3095076 RepID=A0ABZ0ZTY7_9ACTN|nr:MULTISPECIES: hypothetical protein [unclassified Nocardioides]MDZ5621937.1 hypothetical protein [Nocardioides sp. HM23]WQQ27381.1 hypothetical protein SHK19_03930 [Nocardioides sp. HM61]
MTSTFSPRRALVAAALATATGGSLLLAAAPASATPADGRVSAYGYYRDVAGGACSFFESNNGQATKVFTPATGRRTARTGTSFRATPPGDPVSAHGRVENDTSGVADANDGAFDVVRFTADHLVRLTDDTGFDCGMGLIADSQSSAEVRVRRRGQVRLEWDRGAAGQIEQIFVSRNGNPVVDRIRPNAHGDLTFNVRRGKYLIFVQFVTRANERDIPVGQTLTKRAHFRVVADYRR